MNSHNRGLSQPAMLAIAAVLLIGLVIILIPILDRGQNNNIINDPNQEIIESSPGDSLFPDETLLDDGADELDETELIGDILNNPQNYVGRTVTVTSDIAERLSPQTWLLESPGITGDRLLVVGATAPPADNDLLEDTRVRVTGVIRTFNLNQMEQDLNVSLDADDLADYEGEPVLIATSVTRIED